jgi:hypothetical protein
LRALISYDDGNGPGLFVSGGELGSVSCWRAGAWTTVGGGSGDFGLSGFRPSSFAVLDDGQGERLYLGGYFESVGGVAAPRLARWDGSQWEAVGELSMDSGLGIECMAAVRLPGRQASSLFVGGTFQRLGEVFSARIGEWVGCPTGLAADGE